MTNIEKFQQVLEEGIKNQDFFDRFSPHPELKEFISILHENSTVIIDGVNQKGALMRQFISLLKEDSTVYFTDVFNRVGSGTFDGCEVIAPKDLVDRLGEDILVIQTDVQGAGIKTMVNKLLSKLLIKYGLKNCLDVGPLFALHGNFISQYRQYKGAAEWKFKYFLRDSVEREKAMQVIKMLEDDISQIAYCAFFRNFLCHINYGAPEIFMKYSYFPSDIFDFSLNERVVDCGAYDGDTLSYFLQLYGNNFACYDAFEPFPDNFSKLRNMVNDLPESIRHKINIHPFGVSNNSGDTLIHGSNLGAHIELMEQNMAEEPGISIKLCTLDEAVYERMPTLIKMDVEGSEQNALLGTRKIIKDFRPILAISIYHKPQDLIDIPLWIKNEYPEYKLFVRKYNSYSTSMYELVLYAVPPERLHAFLNW